MARHEEISPYLRRKLRPLKQLLQAERAKGIVRDLTEEERTWIREGCPGEFEGFCGFFVEMRNAGGPEDRRYHLRQFFNLLREQIQRHGDIAKALKALDYESIPEEREHWEACARAEIRHTSYCRVMAPRGSGW